MTKDERRQRREANLRAEAEIRRRFPWASLKSHYDYGDPGSVVLRLRAGVEAWLDVEKSGEWDKDEDRPDHENCGIRLRDIEDLAQFIRALICRYNALVDNANEHVTDCVMKRLKRINPDSASPPPPSEQPHPPAAEH